MSERSSEFRDLSPRQQEILILMLSGYSRQGIARRLNVSSNTVRNHVAAIYDRLKVHNRIAVLRWALSQPELVSQIMPSDDASKSLR